MTTRACAHYDTTAGGLCGAAGAVRYLPGWRCPTHTPAALAGHREVVPDPAQTMEGRRAARGLPDAPAPLGSSAGIDKAAVRSPGWHGVSRTYREATR